MSKKKKTFREGSLRGIWGKNKTEFNTRSAGRFAWFRDGSMLGWALQILKLMIMLTVIHGVAMFFSVMVIPHLMVEFYNGIFGGVKPGEITIPMLIGSWGIPCLFYVAVILFAVCCVLVMFWKWLSRLMRDITARHKAKIAAKCKTAEADKYASDK